MSQNIEPLRIQKNPGSLSPSKTNGLPIQRPLAELSPVALRRNSPSYNQNNKQMLGADSSPFDSSPFMAKDSPRSYWQSRDPASPSRFGAENRNPNDRDSSPSPAKRSSIENLKRASRVKNSSMFAREQKREYDPTSSPMIERPLANGRPLNAQSQGHIFNGRALGEFKKENQLPGYAETPQAHTSPAKSAPASTPNGHGSPVKSSLSSKSRYGQAQAFDPANDIWSDEDDQIDRRELPPGKVLHRHAKSVTFDAAPPQVNEYEMTTPDPSSVASGSREGSYDSASNEEDESFDRGSSYDHDDSFDASLEDTQKTPVVLPEDWRFMSPTTANNDLAAHEEDVFSGQKGSPAPEALPVSADGPYTASGRTDSGSSSGTRPLPPLPALEKPHFPRERSESNASLSAATESPNGSRRLSSTNLLPASISKLEIQGMGGCSMSLEDRLRLMMIQDEENTNPGQGDERERRLRRANQSPSPERTEGNKQPRNETAVATEPVDDLDDYKFPPRISRESILRKVKSNHYLRDDHDVAASSPAQSSAYPSTELPLVDPDTPLPSTENDDRLQANGKTTIIKEEEEDNEVDLYSIPDLYNRPIEEDDQASVNDSAPLFGDNARPSEGLSSQEDDDESHYSTDFKHEEHHDLPSSNSVSDDGPPTPRALAPQMMEDDLKDKSHRMSLPQFASMLSHEDFGMSLGSFMTPSPPQEQKPITPANATQSPVPVAQERPITPIAQLQPPTFPDQQPEYDEEPGTPDSVIRRPISPSPAPDSPGVPEPVATIKSSGSRLKTRPSATPADFQAMAQTRRQVSGEGPPAEESLARPVSRPSVIVESEDSTIETEQSPAAPSDLENDSKQIKRKSSLVQLEIPGEDEGGLGTGLSKEFDRLIEAQKVESQSSFPYSWSSLNGPAELVMAHAPRLFGNNHADLPVPKQKGYLMRQNTKVVVASSASQESAVESIDDTAHQRGTRSAGNSPRKPSHTQTWTTEPWNGKVRRKSVRLSVGSPQKKVPGGPAPPLPGQQSNVTGMLGDLNEGDTVFDDQEADESGERGRLFVKVVKVKDLDLQLPRGERPYFALTLDNGLHCVTTAWLELGKTAPIGQEFELIVLNDLEFQLTLQTNIEEPKVAPIIESPTKMAKAAKSSTFSRVFASPKKRKEIEQKQQEEAQRAERQRQQEAQAHRRRTQPTAWDLLHDKVGKDGSFARSYICLTDHENHCFGRPYTVDVPCFNEWAVEEVQNPSSVKSKRSTGGSTMQRRAPYKIGKLELQLFYVPKPKDAKDDDMPKSMNACIRELKEAEAAADKAWEGHLSQQGGDCPYWRRRFFTLKGSKFTAYHEATRQPRATINLAKATKIIDDKSSLTQKETSSKGGGRRKSAFAEEEEGYMYLEEGFRLRFANGETIDFYADSVAEKDDWMKVLCDVVGKDTGKSKGWMDIVMARRKKDAAKPAALQQDSVKAGPAMPAPPTPSKTGQRRSFAPPPVAKDARHSVIEQRRANAAKTRSMIF